MRIRNPAEKCSSYLGSIHGRAGNAGGHIRWMVVTAAAAARHIRVILLDGVHELQVLLVLLQLGGGLLAGLQLLLGGRQLVAQPGVLLAQPFHLRAGNTNIQLFYTYAEIFQLFQLFSY